MSDKEEITTERLVNDWQIAVSRVTRCRQELLMSEKHEKEMQQKVATRIIPTDAKETETFCCWVRFNRKDERLVQVGAQMTDGTRHVYVRPGARS